MPRQQRPETPTGQVHRQEIHRHRRTPHGRRNNILDGGIYEAESSAGSSDPGRCRTPKNATGAINKANAATIIAARQPDACASGPLKKQLIAAPMGTPSVCELETGRGSNWWRWGRT